MDVGIVSVEVIKPSQPTPPNLKTHQFSIIDQYIPHTYVAFPIFYSPPVPANINNPSQTLTFLKSSLSEALTLFYPLAGRIKDDHHIECSDEGVKFVHARVLHRTLSQALCPPPNEDQMRQLFPIEHTVGQELLGIQVSFFECGGIAIGVYSSHKIADARGRCTFLHGWASIAKRGSSVLQPRFDLASLFPPIGAMPSLGEFTEVSTAMTKAFRFEALRIAKLKAKAKVHADEKDRISYTTLVNYFQDVKKLLMRSAFLRCEEVDEKCIKKFFGDLERRAPWKDDEKGIIKLGMEVASDENSPLAECPPRWVGNPRFLLGSTPGWGGWGLRQLSSPCRDSR
ncbi:hypothetical protein Sjap_023384 [Stephania japonica]|uniref:Uncharacterized protein n=1 Tax=Stephania japonica TaxID=461633 RepID=A0AAP0HMM2_9MAGN